MCENIEKLNVKEKSTPKCQELFEWRKEEEEDQNVCEV